MEIGLTSISKSFQDKLILRGVSMTFIEGKISCIMGPSGSGKTTLINILMGLIKPDSGTVTGMERRRIAAVFQEDRLIEHWDAVKNVLLVCNKSINASIIEQHFIEVGLTDYEAKPVSSLSGGMRRRVAIVKAILAESSLIIMDEPFKGLDESLKRQVIDYVKNHTQGKTVLIITHDREEVSLLEAELFLLPRI